MRYIIGLIVLATIALAFFLYRLVMKTPEVDRWLDTTEPDDDSAESLLERKERLKQEAKYTQDRLDRKIKTSQKEKNKLKNL